MRDLKVTRPNQVWATDISYIAMEKGFMFLTAIIDLRSRFVLNWSISNSMEAEWCAEVFNETVKMYGKPEILNTDQGAQYTSDIFTHAVLSKGVKLSMDGKGRATDNAFIERLWRSVKYEKIYLFTPESGQHLASLLEDYFTYYNEQRRHSSIEDMRPKEVFFFYATPRPNEGGLKEKNSTKEHPLPVRHNGGDHQTNCASPNPDSNVKILCGYRLME